MAAPNIISIDKLVRLIGTPKCPVLVDVRGQDDFEADPHLIPSSTRCASNKLEDRAEGYGGKSAIVICQQGSSLSQGAAALLRDQGVPAEVLEGGFEAWRQARLPLVPFAKLPPVDTRGRTVWVTRARPKIDRIACPWLIRRFVDPHAVFLFVAPSDVVAVAERFGGAPVRHRGCILEPSGRHLHVRHHGRGVRIRHPAPASSGEHRSRCGHRAPGAFARGSRFACRVTWPLPHVCGRSTTARSRDVAL